ncbi:MAG: hypothetical protein A2W85_09350 [Bacteroidetes bacterium GWF2_41_31]|nr:MAG: hypothetical protein A2W85_09350 [Bacteroidetes bacterium GWF2_41_31]
MSVGGFKGRAGCGELFNIMAHYGCCFYQSKIPLDILTKNMPIMCIMLFSGGVLFFSGTTGPSIPRDRLWWWLERRGR